MKAESRAKVASSVAIVIPSRMKSTRLPDKAMLRVHGLPMVEHVRRRGTLNSYDIPVIVASGDQQILDVALENGGEAFHTLQSHENGTSRVHEVSQNFEYTHYIVLQGDEILALPAQIDSLIHEILENPTLNYLNLTAKLTNVDEIIDESIVKCVLDSNQKVLFMFRKTPLVGELESQLSTLRKVVGIFAISKSALDKICGTEPSTLEKSQSIEQLRYLETGGFIQSVDTATNFPSINVPEDVKLVDGILSKDLAQQEILARILQFP